MIQVTRINGSHLIINALFIETIEETPDTIITLSNGKKYIVHESSEQVIELVKTYLKEIHFSRLIEIGREGVTINEKE